MKFTIPSFRINLSLREVHHGERLPWYYGVAYEDFPRARLVAYPIPLNHIIATLRNFWFYIMHVKIDEREAWAMSRIQVEKAKIASVVNLKELKGRIKYELHQFLKNIFDIHLTSPGEDRECIHKIVDEKEKFVNKVVNIVQFKEERDEQ